MAAPPENMFSKTSSFPALQVSISREQMEPGGGGLSLPRGAGGLHGAGLPLYLPARLPCSVGREPRPGGEKGPRVPSHRHEHLCHHRGLALETGSLFLMGEPGNIQLLGSRSGADV